MKTMYMKEVALSLTMALFLVLPLTSVAAQGGNGGGEGGGQSGGSGELSESGGDNSGGGQWQGSGSSGGGDQVQATINKPEIAPVDDEDLPYTQLQGQEREQEQNRIQTSANGNPGQVQNQDREQANDMIGSPGEIQYQVQNRVRDPKELQQYIQERTSETNQYNNQGVAMQTRNRVEVATMAVEAAEDILGPNGPEMSQKANEVKTNVQAMIQHEETLQSRSWFSNLIFGQDKETAQTLRQNVEQNRVRIQEMNQLLIDCKDCDEEVKIMLQEQLRTVSQEHDRLQQVADDAVVTNGLFGWLFGG